MAKEFEDRRKVDVVKVLDWLDRYGSLLSYLDEETGGFGTVLVQVHGKRAVKAGPVGRLKVLKHYEWIVDASGKK